MKKIRNLIAVLFAALCAMCLVFAFTACGSDEEKTGGNATAAGSYGHGEEGFYYLDAGDASRYMLSLQSGTYMISVASGTQSYYGAGTYSYDEAAGEISFTDGTESFSAYVTGDALSLEIADSGYSFKAYRDFDVTYVLLDENGKEMSRVTESVLNGQTAEDLYIPVDGYYFVAWYTDEKLTGEFSFDLSVAGDTTLYGWYIEISPVATEFEVTLDYGGGVTEVWNTQNGAILKSLPSSYEGRDIAGWWVSATNTEGELTRKYNPGDELRADTTLFAVYDTGNNLCASVTERGITWDTKNASAYVYINVISEDGWTMYSWQASSSEGSYAPARFFSLETGKYTIEVASGNVTETLTYVVNGLDRVSASLASVLVNGDGRIFSFSPVEGAEGYEITISDGYRTVTEDLGSLTFYNFSGWEMTDKGLTFTVTAYADGMVSSVSEKIEYILVLGKVSVEMEGDTAVWNAVEGAMEYVVTVTDEEGGTYTETVSGTSYSLKYFGKGTYDVTVLPRTGGYYSESATYHAYAKESLAAPVVTGISNYSVSWTAVDDADGYVIMINGVEYEVTLPETGDDGDGGDVLPASEDANEITFYFSDGYVPEDAKEYEIAVKATVEGGTDSAYGDGIIATNGGFSSALTYADGAVYWDCDVSSAYYVAVVNGETSYTSYGGSRVEIALTRVGDNDITVTAYDANEKELGFSEITVYAYSVTLDGNGIIPDTKVLYVAQGDTLNLGGADEVTKEHAELIGWYTQPDYTEGQSESYAGKGSLVADGSTFTANRNVYLYAYWSYEWIEVTLNVGTAGALATGESETVKIKYNSSDYVLPAPETYGVEDSFVGWFSQDHGLGVQYTNDTGAAEETYLGESTELYAYYLTILEFTAATAPNGESVYSVSGGTNINRVTTVTIPETYNGKNIMLQSSAFNTCTRLEVINIPDTVVYIATTNDGYRSGTGAFAECVSLREVNIYETGEPDSTKEVYYFSVDGVLFHKIEDTDDVEIAYYPYAKTDSVYAMPSVVTNSTECDAFGNGITHKVTSIPTQIFRDRRMETLVVSVNVTEIATQAFYNNTYLTEVIFEAGGTGALVMADGAFYSETALVGITLPARYSEFNVEAFSGCSVLMNIDIEEGGVYASDGGVILDATVTTLVYLPSGRTGAIDIGSLTSGNITRIGENAFAGNVRVTSVVIPASVTEICGSAFEGCTGLGTITFEGTANSPDLTIRSRAFYGCTAITSLELPVNLVTLEYNAFGGCTGISSVYFDARQGTKSSDLDFATGAFGTSNNITTLSLGANVPALDNLSGIFDGGHLTTVIVDENNGNYSTDEYGVLFNGDKSTVVFYPRENEGEYTVPDTATKIDSSVFADRELLTKITIGINVNTIGDGAFLGCTSLGEIAVAEGNTNFAAIDGVLYKLEEGEPVELIYCPIQNTVTELEIPASVTATAGRAFAENATVTYVEFLNEDAFVLGAYAFYNAKALKTVILPEGIRNIYEYTFYGCESLTYVNVPAATEAIGAYAFAYCDLSGDLSNTHTRRIYLPEGLVTIDNYAFYGNEHLDVTIPSTVQTIGEYAFAYCWCSSADVAPLVFAKTPEEQGSVPLTIGEHAFAYTWYATDLEIPARTIEIGGEAFLEYAKETASYSPALTFESGCALTVINEKSFQSARIVSVELPSSVTEIGAYAFNQCSQIKTISFAPAGETSSVETIGYQAFRQTGALVAVFPSSDKIPEDSATYSAEFPASLVSIGSEAFSETSNSIQELTFEEGSKLETLATDCFEGWGSLLLAEFPASLSTVGGALFEGNTKIEEVRFLGDATESRLTSLPGNCFEGCTKLVDVYLPQGLIETGDGSTKGIFEGCTGLETISIPAGVQVISPYTFNGCTKLSEITFEKDKDGKCSLAEVGDYAFKDCTSLTSYEFPETTAESIHIGYSIFNGSGVTEVTLNSGVTDLGGMCINANITTINLGTNTSFAANEEGNILMSADGKSLVYIIGELVGDLSDLGEITSIGSAAFTGQTKLTSVTIPASVESIGEYAFNECTSLEKVEIEAGSAMAYNPDALGQYAFYGCTSLTSVNLPEGILEIPDYCFYGCPLSDEFAIPESVVTICSYAFAKTGSIALYLPNVETLESYAFTGSKITSLTTGAYLTSTGTYTFENCENLAQVEFNSVLSTIGNYLFHGCKALTSFDVPEGVTSVGGYAFYECTALVTVSLPSSLVSLGNGVFRGCTNLTSMEIPESVTSVGGQLFYGCSALAEVNIPAGVTELPTYMFYNCTGLLSMDIPYGVTTITDHVFYGCSELASITIPETVTSIDTYFLYGCTALTGVTLPSGLTTVSNYMFRGCTALKSMVIPDAVTSIGTYVFYGCTSLEYLVIPAGCTSIGNYTSYNCSKLATVYYKGASWSDVSIGSTSNSPLRSSSLNVYYYSGEAVNDGQHWHYDTDGVTPIIWGEGT